MRSHKWVRTFLLLCAFALLGGRVFAQGNAQGSGATSAETGVLLLAHGGSKDWNEKVRSVAAEVDKEMPTEIGFGMAERSALQEGIDKLTARGVKRIVAVPLFVSSHSSVIESTKYLLGLRADAPKELADFAMGHEMTGMNGHTASDTGVKKEVAQPVPVKCSVPLQMAPALDRHPIAAKILSDRAAAIAKEPARDVVILVAHEPNDDQENAQWVADMAALASLMAVRSSYARIEYLTVRDDADAPVREQAKAELRKRAQAANDAGYHVLVVPLLLSYGGIEDGVRQRLDGIEHTFALQGLLPDERIAQWVRESARAMTVQH